MQRFRGFADNVSRVVPMEDTEQAFDWLKFCDRDANDVTSMAAQQLAHRIFENHGVVLIYLVNFAETMQDAGRAPLRELLSGGHCDMGAQTNP